MKKSKKDPMPRHFRSLKEAGDFWDEHDLADYWEQTREADLTFDLQKKQYYIAVLPSIAKQLERISREQGVSVETVVNLWFQEKLQAT